MTDYRVTNRGAAIGVLTLSANYPAVNYNELLAPNVKSAATVQAFYFPEPRQVYIVGHATLRKSYGPGMVLISAITTAPVADFVIDTWNAPKVPTAQKIEVY